MVLPYFLRRLFMAFIDVFKEKYEKEALDLLSKLISYDSKIIKDNLDNIL